MKATRLRVLAVWLAAWTSAIITPPSRGQSLDNSRPWFHRIPNETLTGVPREIVESEKYYPRIREFLWSMIGKTGSSREMIKEASRYKKVQRTLPTDLRRSNNDFPCNLQNVRSESRPRNAHEVRPGDIDVIGAMGDSLTAANGAFAFNLFQVAIENRGVSFPIGGQGDWRTFVTLPNILKEFNPNLVGYALGDSSSVNKASQFDVAEPGAMSQDMPFMVKELVKRIRNDARVDFKNDWKLITLMVGSNNVCLDICYYSDPWVTVDMHKQDMMKTLLYLKQNMPRTIVNFVPQPNLKALVDLVGVSPFCRYIKVFECPCLFATQHLPKRKLYLKVMDQWIKTEIEIANSDVLKEKDDFAVTIQPFTANISMPLVRDAGTGKMRSDFSYMSTDCFHLSQKGYATAANALWNNMMEPIEAKSHNWHPLYQKFLCPTEKSPFIYTWKNSPH